MKKARTGNGTLEQEALVMFRSCMIKLVTTSFVFDFFMSQKVWQAFWQDMSTSGYIVTGYMAYNLPKLTAKWEKKNKEHKLVLWFLGAKTDFVVWICFEACQQWHDTNDN